MSAELGFHVWEMQLCREVTSESLYSVRHSLVINHSCPAQYGNFSLFIIWKMVACLTIALCGTDRNLLLILTFRNLTQKLMLKLQSLIPQLFVEWWHISVCFLILYYFAESPFLRGVEDRLGGVILLKCIPSEGRGEFLWTHSSKTMCVSYKSDAERRPKVLYSICIFCVCCLLIMDTKGGLKITDIQSKT